MNKQVITIDLGYIGNKADKLQRLFEGYTPEPNEYGFFLKFEDTSYIGNKGVIVYTNCYESEEQFLDILYTKLLMNF